MDLLFYNWPCRIKLATLKGNVIFIQISFQHYYQKWTSSHKQLKPQKTL